MFTKGVVTSYLNVMKLLLIFAISSLAFLFSCTPKESLVPTEYPVFVRCLLETDTYPSALITLSTGLADTSSYYYPDTVLYYWDSSLKLCHPVENAHVLLYKNGEVADSMVYNSNCQRYVGLKYKIEANAAYRIEIRMDGKALVYAECTVPAYPDVMLMDSFSNDADGNDQSLFGLCIPDSMIYEDSYHINYKREFCIKFRDNANRADYYSLTADLYTSCYGWATGLGLGLWNNDYDPLVEGAYETPSIETVGALHQNGVTAFFSDHSINGKIYALNTLKTTKYLNDSILLKFSAISEEWYRRMKSESLFMKNRDDSYSEPVTVFSNIHNGVGIFGGMAVVSKIFGETNSKLKP